MSSGVLALSAVAAVPTVFVMLAASVVVVVAAPTVHRGPILVSAVIVAQHEDVGLVALFVVLAHRHIPLTAGGRARGGERRRGSHLADPKGDEQRGDDDEEGCAATPVDSLVRELPSNSRRAMIHDVLLPSPD